MTAEGKLTVVRQGERDILITRAFDAPRKLMWDACTKPELVKRWLFGPVGWSMPECEIDLRVGGRYRYLWRNVDGREMAMGGAYREIKAHERIVQTELFDEDWTGGETVSTLVFTEKAGRTTLVNTVRYSSSDAREGALKTPMADGMEAGYARLDEILKTQV